MASRHRRLCLVQSLLLSENLGAQFAGDGLDGCGEHLSIVLHEGSAWLGEVLERDAEVLDLVPP